VAVITKIDLAAAVGFDRDTLVQNIQTVRPSLDVLEVSARSGEGLTLMSFTTRCDRNRDRNREESRARRPGGGEESGRRAPPLSRAERETACARLPPRHRGREAHPIADPPASLDYEGAEILLIGATKDIHAELGIDLRPQHESEADAAIFRELKIERSLHPIESLVSGKWA
jgi:hypothetical protein